MNVEKRWAISLLPLAVMNVYADDIATHVEQQEIENIIVTGHLMKSQLDTMLPVTLLGGEELSQQVATSLGQTLKNQAGIQSQSFGGGVGLPVIRGQSGNRVRVLQDGIGTLDASAVSPDHANSLSPFAAERIEVVRGPATLLYGSGAVGGVVNVIDQRIHQTLPEETSVRLLQNYSSNGDQNQTAFALDAATGSVAWHFDAFQSRSGNIEIPGYAIHHEEHEDHDEELIGEEDHADEEGSFGFIDNTQSETQSFTLGTSWITDKGFLGFSASRIDKKYGLPAGVHAHSEDEALLVSDTDLVEEDIEVGIEMQQTRYEFKGKGQLTGWFESVEGHLAYSDYEHQELESGHHDDDNAEAIDEEHHDEHGTEYFNRGWESRILLTQAPINGVMGVLGAQLQNREFGSEGEEGFIRPTDITSAGVFAMESFEHGDWLYEIGGRAERIEYQMGACDDDHSVFSASGSAMYELSEESRVYFGLNHSQRAPSEEELYSNIESTSCSLGEASSWIEHAATAQIELGNPELKPETSRNFEFGYRSQGEQTKLEVNIYHNRVSDYIYQAETGIDETVVYDQRDATFYGFEAEQQGTLMDADDFHVDYRVFGDFVGASFSSGEHVPRISPMRLGVGFDYIVAKGSIKLDVTQSFKQDDVAEGEEPTESYTEVSLYGDHHLNSVDSAVVYLQIDNLLDEDIRNHLSAIKDYAPEPGRSIEIGIRLNF